SIFELILDDGTARLHCRWWNLPFMEKYFAVGDEVVVYGKPLTLRPRTIDHPETEVVQSEDENFIHLNRITPVYPLTEGLPQRWLRSLIWRTAQFKVSDSRGQVSGKAGARGRAPDPSHLTPDTSSDIPGFISRAEAIQRLHFPEAMADIESARRRLALDE